MISWSPREDQVRKWRAGQLQRPVKFGLLFIVGNGSVIEEEAGNNFTPIQTVIAMD